MTTCWIVRTGRTLSTDRSARWGWGSSSRTRLVVSAVSVKPRERLNDVIANHRQELDVQSLQGNENKGVCQKHPRGGGMQKWGGGRLQAPVFVGGRPTWRTFQGCQCSGGGYSPFWGAIAPQGQKWGLFWG